MNDIKTVFANRIIELRTERELSQKEMADEIGISQALLSHYEKMRRECGLDTLIAFSHFFNVSLDYLLGLNDDRGAAVLPNSDVLAKERFANVLSALAKETGKKQGDLAQEFEISQGLISHYIKGRRECSLEFVIKCAEYFNVSCNELFESKESNCKEDVVPIVQEKVESKTESIKKNNSVDAPVFIINKVQGKKDYTELFEEIKKRYPNGIPKVSVIAAENKDLPIKTLQNEAPKLYGMSLSKYLVQIGLILENNKSDEDKLDEAKKYINDFVEDILQEFGNNILLKMTEMGINRYNNIQKLNNCTKLVYGITAHEYLEIAGIVLP